MRKLKVFVSAILVGATLLVSNSTVYASTDVLHHELLDSNDFEPILSDEEMYLRVLDQGKAIENEVNLKNAKSATTEQWTLTGTKTLVSNTTLSTKYNKTLSAGQSATTSSSSFTFSVGTELKGFSLNVSFSGPTTSISYSGPGMSEKVGNTSNAATHSFVVFAQQGSVVQYTYRVTNAVGTYLRTEVKNAVVNGGNYAYNLRGNIASNNRLIVENSNRNKTKTFTTVSSYTTSFGNNKSGSLFF